MKKMFLWFLIGEAFIIPLIVYQHSLGAFRVPLMVGAAVSCFMGFKALDAALRSEQRTERIVARCLVAAMIVVAVAGAVVQFWPKI